MPLPTRHIPGCDIRQLGDIRFQPALEAALAPSETYDTRRWLFVPNHYSEYRYILGTRGERPLICVGVNPSTARPDALDPTLQSVQRIALAGGYDSFIMFNVYAQRATSPQDMDREKNPELHRENLAAFDYILSLSPAPAVWAAWGNVIEVRPYLPGCVRDMIEVGQRHGASWFRCGPLSRKGHPHHPLYLRRDEPLVPFDVAEYLQALGDRSARPKAD